MYETRAVVTDGCVILIEESQIVTRGGQPTCLTPFLAVLKSETLQETATYRGEQQLAVRWNE